MDLVDDKAKVRATDSSVKAWQVGSLLLTMLTGMLHHGLITTFATGSS